MIRQPEAVVPALVSNHEAGRCRRPGRRHSSIVYHVVWLNFNYLTSKSQLWVPKQSGASLPGGTVKNILAKFWADESAATAIEYGLIAAGISLAIIAVVNGLGANLNTKFTSINTSLK